jgi:hypothetical protein
MRECCSPLRWGAVPHYAGESFPTTLGSCSPLRWGAVPHYAGELFPTMLGSHSPLCWGAVPHYAGELFSTMLGSRSPLRWGAVPHYAGESFPTTREQATPVLILHNGCCLKGGAAVPIKLRLCIRQATPALIFHYVIFYIIRPCLKAGSKDNAPQSQAVSLQ